MPEWLSCFLFWVFISHKSSSFEFDKISFMIVLLEKAMAPHSSTLAWKIPRTEEPGRLQSMGSLRVGHDWATSLSCVGEENGNPLQCSCLENTRDGEAWWAAVCGVAQSRTRLKQLSSSEMIRWILYLISRKKQWQPTPVLLPGKSHGRRSLVGCSPWGR